MRKASLEEVVQDRSDRIFNGVFQIKSMENTIVDEGADSEAGKNAINIIKNYTIEDVFNDIEESLQSSPFAQYHCSLTASEKMLITPFILQVLNKLKSEYS